MWLPKLRQFGHIPTLYFYYVLYHKLIHNARHHLNYFPDARQLCPGPSCRHQDPRFKFFWRNLGSFGVWLTGSRAGRWLLPLAADQYKWEN